MVSIKKRDQCNFSGTFICSVTQFKRKKAKKKFPPHTLVKKIQLDLEDQRNTSRILKIATNGTSYSFSNPDASAVQTDMQHNGNIKIKWGTGCIGNA